MQCSKYAVCSVCAGGVWRLDDRQRQAAAHPPLPYLLAQLVFNIPLILPSFCVSHISDLVIVQLCLGGRQGVTEPHTDAVRDSLTYDTQEEEKEEVGTVHTHTSPSILCSWDWLPAKPTMRASTPRAAKALWVPTILTASAKAGLMASQGPSSAGSPGAGLPA